MMQCRVIAINRSDRSRKIENLAQQLFFIFSRLKKLNAEVTNLKFIFPENLSGSANKNFKVVDSTDLNLAVPFEDKQEWHWQRLDDFPGCSCDRIKGVVHMPLRFYRCPQSSQKRLNQVAVRVYFKNPDALSKVIMNLHDFRRLAERKLSFLLYDSRTRVYHQAYETDLVVPGPIIELSKPFFSFLRYAQS